jgi:hypothetical protein
MAIDFERIAPVLPVRDVHAAVAHYQRLGFTAEAYKESGVVNPTYGFASRGSIELHFSLVKSLKPNENTSACYLYCSDAAALYEEWRATGVAGRFIAAHPTPYGLLEMAHVDPDGNLLRIGSPLGDTQAE